MTEHAGETEQPETITHAEVLISTEHAAGIEATSHTEEYPGPELTESELGMGYTVHRLNYTGLETVTTEMVALSEGISNPSSNAEETIAVTSEHKELSVSSATGAEASTLPYSTGKEHIYLGRLSYKPLPVSVTVVETTKSYENVEISEINELSKELANILEEENKKELGTTGVLEMYGTSLAEVSYSHAVEVPAGAANISIPEFPTVSVGGTNAEGITPIPSATGHAVTEYTEQETAVGSVETITSSVESKSTGQALSGVTGAPTSSPGEVANAASEHTEEAGHTVTEYIAEYTEGIQTEPTEEGETKGTHTETEMITTSVELTGTLKEHVTTEHPPEFTEETKVQSPETEAASLSAESKVTSEKHAHTTAYTEETNLEYTKTEVESVSTEKGSTKAGPSESEAPISKTELVTEAEHITEYPEGIKTEGTEGEEIKGAHTEMKVIATSVESTGALEEHATTEHSAEFTKETKVQPAETEVVSLSAESEVTSEKHAQTAEYTEETKAEYTKTAFAEEHVHIASKETTQETEYIFSVEYTPTTNELYTEELTEEEIKGATIELKHVTTEEHTSMPVTEEYITEVAFTEHSLEEHETKESTTEEQIHHLTEISISTQVNEHYKIEEATEVFSKEHVTEKLSTKEQTEYVSEAATERHVSEEVTEVVSAERSEEIGEATAEHSKQEEQTTAKQTEYVTEEYISTQITPERETGEVTEAISTEEETEHVTGEHVSAQLTEEHETEEVTEAVAHVSEEYATTQMTAEYETEEVTKIITEEYTIEEVGKLVTSEQTIKEEETEHTIESQVTEEHTTEQSGKTEEHTVEEEYSTEVHASTEEHIAETYAIEQQAETTSEGHAERTTEEGIEHASEEETEHTAPVYFTETATEFVEYTEELTTHEEGYTTEFKSFEFSEEYTIPRAEKYETTEFVEYSKEENITEELTGTGYTTEETEEFSPAERKTHTVEEHTGHGLDQQAGGFTHMKNINFSTEAEENEEYTGESKHENVTKYKSTTVSRESTQMPITINLPTYFPNTSETFKSFQEYYTTTAKTVLIFDDEEFDTTLNPEFFKSMKMADFEKVTEFPPTTELLPNGTSSVNISFSGEAEETSRHPTHKSTHHFANITHAANATHTPKVTHAKHANATAEEGLSSGTTEYATPSFNFKVTPLEIKPECSLAEFNTKKNCMCSIDNLVQDLRLKTKEKDFHQVLDQYLCPKFTLAKPGVVIGKPPPQQKHRRRKRSLHWDLFRREAEPKTKNATGFHESFLNDVDIEDTDYHMYAMPGTRIKIPCIGGTNNNNSQEMANFVWKYSDGKPLTEGKKQENGNLIIENIIPQDGGNYTCENGAIKYPHQLTVVALATYTIAANILYNFPGKCTNEYIQLMYGSFPMKFEGMLCGETNSVCFVNVTNRCVKKVTDYVAVDMLIVVEPINVIIPTLDVTICKISCQQKIYAKLISILIKNVEIFENLPVFYSLGGKKFDLTPTSPVNGSNVTDVTSLPSLMLECFPGFGLLEQSHICGACPKNTYSTGEPPTCIKCPHKQYQPMTGSKSCLPCETYLEDPACIPLMEMDVKKFKILVASLFGGAVFFLVVCCICICTKAQKREAAVSTYSDDGEKTPTKNRRRQKSKDVEKQEELLSLYERDKYRRKYTEAPKPPPPDFS